MNSIRCPECQKEIRPDDYDKVHDAYDFNQSAAEIICENCEQRFEAYVESVNYEYVTEKLSPLEYEICDKEYDFWGERINLKYNEKVKKYLCPHCTDLIQNQLELFKEEVC